MIKRAFFVAGTDTDVGKTFISCALLQAARATGSTLGLKPLASGADMTPDGLRNSDALLLQSASSVELPYEQVNPVVFAPAAAPHIAATWENRRLSADRLAGFCRASLRLADFTLIEGAGGWRVPLNQQETLASVAVLLKLPVILVVGVKLGCINHALLTIEAIRNDGLTLAGWVANGVRSDFVGADETLAYLRAAIPAPCLGVVPYLSEMNLADAVNYLDVTLLSD